MVRNLGWTGSRTDYSESVEASVNEVDVLNTHTLKRIRRMYLYDQILDTIGWISLIGIIAAGCYWLVQL